MKMTSPLTISHNSLEHREKLADIMLFWIYLLSFFQPHAIFRKRMNHRWSQEYVLNRHQSLHKSLLTLLTSLWSSLLFIPPFQQLIPSLQSPYRFWAAPREQGFWEGDACLLWRSMENYLDWEEKHYLQYLRVSRGTFCYLCQFYGKYFKKETTLP